MTKHGLFNWNELMTWNAEKAKAFYGGIFGWTYDTMKTPGGEDYFIAMAGDTPAAGILQMSEPKFKGVPEYWFAYIQTENVDVSIKDIGTAGGKILQPAFDIPNVGRIAIVQDINGAHFGLHTPMKK